MKLRRRATIRAVLVGAALLFWAFPALPHGDLLWPAQYTNATGTPCCTLDTGQGDCVRVSPEVAMGLRLGATITLDYPSGTRTTRINAIHIGPEPAICAPGCLFSAAGS